jgi:arylsulfatase
MKKYLPSLCAIALAGWVAPGQAKDIVHDAEYYIIEAQNGERWRADDKEIDARFAKLREANDGKPPNIVYGLSARYAWPSRETGRKRHNDRSTMQKAR